METKVKGIVIVDDMPKYVEAMLVNGIVYLKNKDCLDLIIKLLTNLNDSV